MSNISDVLRLLNPWWEEKNISEKLALPYKRKVFDKIDGLKKYRQIVVLTGLRRVGKTTLLYQTMKQLLEEVEQKKVLYFNFDKEVEDILELFEAYKELTNVDYRKENIFVFFDEITKLNKWANELKLIYDANPNIKFYVSSSSSVNLEEDAIKNLAGRYFLIQLNPLSFKEFLELRNKQEIYKNQKLHERELKKEFSSYLLRSFPETIDWNDELIIKDYLKTTVIDKIIKSDLPERFRNVNKDLLFMLLTLFYKEPGMYLDYDNIAKSLRISKNTLYKHIFYLEFCYLIRLVKNFRPSTLSTTRKMQRVYPYWWTLAYCYGENQDKIVETLIGSIINGKYYWRDLEKEIDFLQVEGKKILPIEVKNKEKIRERELNHINFFMHKYKSKEAKLIYLGEEEVRNVDGKKIHLMPFWRFLLEE